MRSPPPTFATKKMGMVVSHPTYLHRCLNSLRARGRPRLAVRLHLHSDAVDGLFGTVENPPKWLRRHIHDQTSLAVPALDRLHDISVRRQFSAVRSKVVYRSLHLD